MQSERKLAQRIKACLKQAEDLLLTGLTRQGKVYYVEQDAVEKREASIAVIKAYRALSKLDGRHPNYWKRVYYLARDIVRGNEDYLDYIFRAGKTPEFIRVAIKRIAKEGRALSLSEELPVQARISAGRLFLLLDEVYAAQIPDPKRGCSASLCTNCAEPVAFCDQKCSNCGMEFIGPFGFPNLFKWNRLTLPEKRKSVVEVYKRDNHGKLKIVNASNRVA